MNIMGRERESYADIELVNLATELTTIELAYNSLYEQDNHHELLPSLAEREQAIRARMVEIEATTMHGLHCKVDLLKGRLPMDDGRLHSSADEYEQMIYSVLQDFERLTASTPTAAGEDYRQVVRFRYLEPMVCKVMNLVRMFEMALNTALDDRTARKERRSVEVYHEDREMLEDAARRLLFEMSELKHAYYVAWHGREDHGQ